MEISEMRDKIDAIDEQMLGLFLERMKVSEEIGAYKQQNGLPVFNKAREREVLAGAQQRAGEAYEQYAYTFFQTLMNLSKARQSERMPLHSAAAKTISEALAGGEELFPRSALVACQGVEGSNSQAACDQLFSRGRILYVKSFEAVFDAVESGLCPFGVVPVENSSNGSVRAVYDLLQTRGLSVVRAVSLNIRHELLARPGAKLEDIREIYSHEQALGQCSRFLASLGEGVRSIPCGNTAVAARMVAESGRDDCAAISSHACASLYGLSVLKDSIQNTDNNYTRFLCIAKKPAVYAGADRISLVLSCNNTPGALYDILSKLAVRGINMSKLESCPVVGKNFEFVFFLELDASVREPGVVAMLEELERDCESFSFLGCYSMV